VNFHLTKRLISRVFTGKRGNKPDQKISYKQDSPNNYFRRPDYGRYSKFLSEWIPLSNLNGLEIGPLDKPLLLQSSYHVKYLDVFPVEKLVEKCIANPNRDEKNIVALDYVTGGSNTSEVVDQKFDYVNRPDFTGDSIL